MPTYEYECKKCHYHFEKFQSITAKPDKKCPQCGGNVERLISAGAGFIFKGSGFYITDYRSPEYKKKEKEEKKEPAGKIDEKKSFSSELKNKESEKS